MTYKEDIVKYIEKIADREKLSPATVCDKLAGSAFIYKRLTTGKGSCTMVKAQIFRDAAKSHKEFIRLVSK